MPVIVNNSISLDGFICGPQGEEEWISEADAQYFEQACSGADLVLMGSGTFDANQGLYPIPEKENIVFTKTASDRKPAKGITFTDQDPVAFIQENKEERLLIAGGGTLNATLLKAGVVTHVDVCIHPIILGGGKRQFEGIDFSNKTKLEKKSEKDIGDGVIHVEYSVVQ